MDELFAKEIVEGLSQEHKSLPSKYFYDEKGDKLFQEIMQLEEYYPTQCEYEILDRQRESICQAFHHLQPFKLIELGAGDGYKTKLLLQEMMERQFDFTYVPIDISAAVLEELQTDLRKRWPKLKVDPKAQTYFESLEKLDQNTPKVILFLGGNMGNFKSEKANRFLQNLNQQLKPGDLFFTAFDLKKDPHIILQAYNDKAGVTKDFNLNLLARINQELKADFQLDQFAHYPTYDPLSGETKSYLISLRKQNVRLQAVNESFHFEQAEAIFTEVSKKYHPHQISELATSNGFEVVENFTDKRNYFVDSLWRKCQ